MNHAPLTRCVDLPFLRGRVRIRAAAGFSLVEMIVTMAVAAVLISLAAPPLGRMLRANRVQASANALLADMQFARSEAIKRGFSVTMCPSSDRTNCLNANEWHRGWIVMFDKNGDRQLNAGTAEAILRVRAPLSSGDTLIATPDTRFIIFNREGFTANLTTALVNFRLASSEATNPATQCIAVGLGGRATVQPPAKGSQLCQ